IFSVAEVVSYASRHMTLEPGDLIITGTPEGVILGMPEPRVWLKPGDEVTVEVEGLGKLVTPLTS
ncbi:MAG: fumarylacetoacetate hydrolase family protein, partial [Chloroflexi bacterium]|nr:fumarylacetoacetate hydrolase family protein [Chloroflexota bacterium]